MDDHEHLIKERRRKTENKKREAHGLPPVVPFQLPATEFQNPASFPQDAAPVLRRRKLTKKQFAQFVENFPMFLAGYCSADAAIMIQTLIRLGDIEAIKLFLSTIGLAKSSPQTTISFLQQNNVVNNGSGQSERTIDTLVRQLDERDRRRQGAITVEPVKQITQ